MQANPVLRRWLQTLGLSDKHRRHAQRVISHCQHMPFASYSDHDGDYLDLVWCEGCRPKKSASPRT